ncbi:MAG: hypothetical protein KDD44_07460 [Bdellovibrionales bacterium]|nr:hypothetical protein [Bdellovibrionales bacterium]
MNDSSASGENSKQDTRKTLELLEIKIEELKIQYEQYFIDVIKFPPTSDVSNVERMIRKLYSAPFRNAQINFKLNTLVQRFKTYKNYWDRVQKQREDGTYRKDKFKANLRKGADPSIMPKKSADPRDAAMSKLFNNYVRALVNTGASTDNLDYDKFKASVMKKAQTLREEHGAKTVNYKVIVKDGKVSVKTTTK